MFNGLNNEMSMDAIAVTSVLTNDDVKRNRSLKIKGYDKTHLEEDVKIEEEYLNHLLHAKKK